VVEARSHRPDLTSIFGPDPAPEQGRHRFDRRVTGRFFDGGTEQLGSDPGGTAMNRRSVLTTTFVAAATTAIVGISAVTGATDQPARHPNDGSPVAAYVRAEKLNLTGLSPASMRTVSPSSASDRGAIVRFAVENNLTGLSPASLRPIDD
jgi:hypothetical protein